MTTRKQVNVSVIKMAQIAANVETRAIKAETDAKKAKAEILTDTQHAWLTAKAEAATVIYFAKTMPEAGIEAMLGGKKAFKSGNSRPKKACQDIRTAFLIDAFAVAYGRKDKETVVNGAIRKIETIASAFAETPNTYAAIMGRIEGLTDEEAVDNIASYISHDFTVERGDDQVALESRGARWSWATPTDTLLERLTKAAEKCAKAGDTEAACLKAVSKAYAATKDKATKAKAIKATKAVAAGRAVSAKPGEVRAAQKRAKRS
tara:strand:- start:10030 stop:10815 length:786 start_codon:yes stop_codon:yes gene_type:complete